VITIPESLTFYWGDPTNRAAVNLLAGKTEVPLDLSLDEVEHFELASLAAQRVRVDFWRLLRSIWSATWDAPIRAALPSARLLTYGEHRSYPYDEANPSVNNTWDTRQLHCIYAISGHGHLGTCVWFPDKRNEREVEIGFYVADANGDCSISNDLEIGPEWTDDGNGWRVTGPRTVQLSENSAEIDPKPLLALSQPAMAALAAALRGGNPNSARA
jgi:hypothetical protein